MRIADMIIGKVYGHSPGHHGIVEPVVLLSTELFRVVKVGDKFEVDVSIGKHRRVMGTSRGVLVVSAPSEVWEAARAGQDVDSLREVDEIYSKNLIVVDNLPPRGAPPQEFEQSEFNSVRVVAPTHMRGPFAELVPEHDRVTQERHAKYGEQAAEEGRKQQLFIDLKAKLGQHGIQRATFLRHPAQEVRMPFEEFALMAELALKPRRR
jgi:hypothetical protein